MLRCLIAKLMVELQFDDKALMLFWAMERDGESWLRRSRWKEKGGGSEKNHKREMPGPTGRRLSSGLMWRWGCRKGARKAWVWEMLQGWRLWPWKQWRRGRCCQHALFPGQEDDGETGRGWTLFSQTSYLCLFVFPASNRWMFPTSDTYWPDVSWKNRSIVSVLL